MFFADARSLIPLLRDRVLVLSMIASGMRRVGRKLSLKGSQI